jgi:hypothetical protein
VFNVAHLGRHPTAHQRGALEVRHPECVVGGCHVRVGLEIDHVEPWSATRVTKLDRLARLCRFHHAQKTTASARARKRRARICGAAIASIEGVGW